MTFSKDGDGTLSPRWLRCTVLPFDRQTYAIKFNYYCTCATLSPCSWRHMAGNVREEDAFKMPSAQIPFETLPNACLSKFNRLLIVFRFHGINGILCCSIRSKYSPSICFGMTFAILAHPKTLATIYFAYLLVFTRWRLFASLFLTLLLCLVQLRWKTWTGFDRQ